MNGKMKNTQWYLKHNKKQFFMTDNLAYEKKEENYVFFINSEEVTLKQEEAN